MPSPICLSPWRGTSPTTAATTQADVSATSCAGSRKLCAALAHRSAGSTAKRLAKGQAGAWHLALYVPLDLRAKFRTRFRGWLRAQAGGAMLAGAVNFKPVWYMVGLKRYLLKDGTDEVRAMFDVPDNWTRTGGVVMGARIAVSPTINAKARHEAGRSHAEVSVATVVQISPRRLPVATPEPLAA